MSENRAIVNCAYKNLAFSKLALTGSYVNSAY